MHSDTHPHAAGPTALLRSLWQQRGLLIQLTKRDIQGRYRGSALGVLWSFLTPLLMLLVYTFVFAGVFKARWGQAGGNADSTSHFAIVLFSGLMIHAWCSECLSRAPTVIIHHSSFVTKIIFPLEIFSPMLLLSATFNLVISLGILLVAMTALHMPLHATILTLPLILAPFALLLLGGVWLLAAMGVFLRDIGQMIGLLMTILMFLSPIFYPVENLPEHLRPFIYLNPLSFIIEQVRGALLWGQPPAWQGLAWYYLGGCTATLSGFFCFQRARKAFADVL